MIPESVERKARWVLDSIGARNLGIGDDVPYREEAWEAVRRGQRPEGDELAEAFYHLARLEELDGSRDRHGRFSVESSCLDPLDPPLERLRTRLGVEPPTWRGAGFAVVLTHDVDIPWRWTRIGIKGAAARLKGHVLSGRGSQAFYEARALATIPVHKLRGSDPNWSFGRILRVEQSRGARSTFFLMGGHGHPADGASPEAYDELRPKLVETLQAANAEVGLHGSYTAADSVRRLEEEKQRLEFLAGPVRGQRYHYLRIDPHSNLAPLDQLGFVYDSSMGFADAPGFRAGIAHPYRPWDVENDRPLDLIEIPLAAMDVTFSADHYMGLSASAAEKRLLDLIEWAAVHGGGFAVLWHTDRYDPSTSRGWDRLYLRVLDAVRARGGIALSAGELAEEAAEWLR